MKKIKTGMFAAIALMILVSPLFAQEEKNPFSLSLTTDFAYYPASEVIPGGDHFSKIVGPYSGVEACTTLNGSVQNIKPVVWLMKLREL